ncbi:MAG: polymer-forming cytoskeletal protein [Chloroflexi bacterium]|nr:polymer-forming cytoskeletal protein [Chloroflexota bacterium]
MSAFFANRRGQAEVETEETVTVMPAGRPVGFDTVVGSNTQFEGSFASSGNVRMDGKFAGSLEISGNILVGESADIRADINARNISIAGTVRGNVTGNKVQLLRTGRIWGDISASALTTEEGAFIDGKITMVGHDATRPPTDDEVIEHELALEEMDGESTDEDDASAEVDVETTEPEEASEASKKE